MQRIGQLIGAVVEWIDNHRWTRVAKRAVVRFLEHDDLQYAGSMAYFALLSVFQLLVLGVVILSNFVEQGRVREFITQHLTRASPIDAETLYAVINAVVESRGGISLFGVAFLIWGALGLFSAVNKGINLAWAGPGGPPPSFLRDKIIGLVLILFTGALVIASVAVGVVLGVLQRGTSGFAARVPGGDLFFVAIGLVVPLLFAFIALLFLYSLVPTPKVSIRQVWPGALVAALLWEGLRYGFVFFATDVVRYDDAFGPISTGVLLLVFLYFSSVVLLLGAEVAEAHSVEKGHTREPAAAAVVVGPSVPIDAGPGGAGGAVGSTASLTADAFPQPPAPARPRRRGPLRRWLPLAGVGAVGVLIGRWLNRDRDE